MRLSINCSETRPYDRTALQIIASRDPNQIDFPGPIQETGHTIDGLFLLHRH
jgi:hypothetical protein